MGPSGELVVLAEQDRSRWNRELIAEGHELVRRCLRRGRPGPYQLQAAINAVHTDGPATDWTQVLALYDQLLRHSPTPVVALNRAVAVAEVHGPDAALAIVDDLDLPGYHLLPATRADLLARLGRTAGPSPPTTRPSTWPPTTPSGPSWRRDEHALSRTPESGRPISW